MLAGTPLYFATSPKRVNCCFPNGKITIRFTGAPAPHPTLLLFSQATMFPQLPCSAQHDCMRLFRCIQPGVSVPLQAAPGGTEAAAGG